MDRLVPLTFALPLLGAAISLVAVRRLRAQRILNIVCLAASLAVSVVLLVHVERTDTAAVAHIGAWPSDIGITYVLDRLSGMLLVIACITMLAVLVFAIGQRHRDDLSPSTTRLPGPDRRGRRSPSSPATCSTCSSRSRSCWPPATCSSPSGAGATRSAPA